MQREEGAGGGGSGGRGGGGCSAGSRQQEPRGAKHSAVGAWRGSSPRGPADTGGGWEPGLGAGLRV